MSPETSNGSPPIVRLPEVGIYIPSNVRMMVVLPEPFEPSRPNVSPRLTSKLRLSITGVFPKDIENPSMLTMDVFISIIIRCLKIFSV